MFRRRRPDPQPSGNAQPHVPQPHIPQPPAGAHPGRGEGGTVAAACEAYLAGRYAAYLIACRRTVPPWALLNRLAHAEPETVLALASQHDDVPGPGELPWSASARLLAAHIVAESGGEVAVIASLQREALVPLELSLIGGARRGPLSSSVTTLAWNAIDDWASARVTRRDGRQQ